MRGANAHRLEPSAQLVEAAGAEIGRASAQRMRMQGKGRRVGPLDGLRDRLQPRGKVEDKKIDQLVQQVILARY